jgi:Mg-chelatase subunit ChlD
MAESMEVELPSGWDAATRLGRLRTQLSPGSRFREVERRAVDAVLARARALLRHAMIPSRLVEGRWPGEGELDLDATLEGEPHEEGFWPVLQRREPRRASPTLILDLSLSMSGEHVAIVAVAAAILRLKLERVAVVAFGSTARVLVRAGEVTSPRELVRRVLSVPAQGYTHLEEGLRVAASEALRMRPRGGVGLLLSDGMANMGWDPARQAGRFRRLHVLYVGACRGRGWATCRRLVRIGQGRLLAVRSAEGLPEATRAALRSLFRA